MPAVRGMFITQVRGFLVSPLQVKGDGGTDGGPGLLVCGATGNSCPSGEGRPEGVCVLVEGLQNPVTADLIHIQIGRAHV